MNLTFIKAVDVSTSSCEVASAVLCSCEIVAGGVMKNILKFFFKSYLHCEGRPITFALPIRRRGQEIGRID